MRKCQSCIDNFTAKVVKRNWHNKITICLTHVCCTSLGKCKTRRMTQEGCDNDGGYIVAQITMQHYIATQQPCKTCHCRISFWHVVLELFDLRPLSSPQGFQPSRVCNERGLQLQARHCCCAEGLQVAGHATGVRLIYKATLAKNSPDHKDLAAEICNLKQLHSCKAI